MQAKETLPVTGSLWIKVHDSEGRLKLVRFLDKSVANVIHSKDHVIRFDKERFDFYLSLYTNCPSSFENQGHRFGEDLPDADKPVFSKSSPR